MSVQFWVESPEQWHGLPPDPWAGGPYVCYVPAPDEAAARRTYLTYRDGSDEHAVEMVWRGDVCGTLAAAEDMVALAAMEARELTIFRVTGAP